MKGDHISDNYCKVIIQYVTSQNILTCHPEVLLYCPSTNSRHLHDNLHQSQMVGPGHRHVLVFALATNVQHGPDNIGRQSTK